MMEDKGFAVDQEMQVVAFKVGREDFGVDVQKVEGVISLVDITRMPKAPHFVEGIINLRGQIVAVIDLASRLGIETSERGSATRIVVVEAQEMKVGLIVESPEVININQDDIEASPMLATSDVDASFIRGVVKLDDRLLILLDVNRVLSDQERSDIGEVDMLTVSETGEEE
jgi:purine-binding chemotaxis protein CheW